MKKFRRQDFASKRTLKIDMKVDMFMNVFFPERPEKSSTMIPQPQVAT